jgi:D-alanyl-D-alanine carboxypeptidase
MVKTEAEQQLIRAGRNIRGAATSGNMRLETIAAGATTSRGWTQEQQLLRVGHNIWRSSNFCQYEAGGDSSKSNKF